MKYLTFLLIAAALGCAQGCSTAPRAAATDTGDVQKVTWTKGRDGAPFRDQYGVCHTFSPDTQAALRSLGEQVKACFEGSLPEVSVTNPELKSVKVAWKKVPREQITDAYADATAQSMLQTTGPGRRKTAVIFAVRGFYVYNADTCHVIVSDHQDYVGTLGHEFKHCVDGHFHDDQGGWKHDHAA